MHLVIIRGEGGDACPSDEELRARVRARIGSEPFLAERPAQKSSSARELRVGIERIGIDDEELLVRIALFSSTGSRLGRRELRGHVDCEDLAGDVVLAVAIAIDPLLLVRRAPPPTAPAATESGRGAAANLAAAGDLREVRVEEPSGPIPAPAGVAGRALVSVVGGVGVVAVPSVRGEVSFDYGVLDLDLGVRFDVPTRYPVNATALVDVSLIGLEGGPCIGTDFDLTTLEGCGVGELGLLVAQGINFAASRSVTAPWVAIGARGSATFHVWDALAVVVGVDLETPLVRPRFVDDITRQVFFQPGPLAGSAGVGLELQLR